MARQPGIWQRNNTGWYYTTLRGKQIRLSLDKTEAQRELHRLLAQEPEETIEISRNPTMRKAADLFLEHGKNEKAEETWAVQRRLLQSFCDHVKKKRVADLKPHMVGSWLDRHPTWGPSMRSNCRKIVKACLNWLLDQGYIREHPLQRMKAGGYARRERILTPEERGKVRRVVEGKPLGDFLRALELTGARPFTEVGSMTAQMVNLKEGTITFSKHKNQKKGKTRVIYMTPELREMVERRMLQFPEGPLFRSSRKGTWTKGAVCHRMRWLERKSGVPKLNPYCWRHTYITDCLVRGLTPSVIAELVGNSPATIHKYYSHLDQHKQTLRDAALQAVSGCTSVPPPPSPAVLPFPDTRPAAQA